jgi:UDP-2-acetamido-2-deoxy-ribo-hexuluronate aminotransferase
MVDYLGNNNIPTNIYYKIPLHLQRVFKYLNYKKGEFPQSESIANRIISIPMHPYLNEVDQQFIINKTNSFSKLH